MNDDSYGSTLREKMKESMQKSFHPLNRKEPIDLGNKVERWLLILISIAVVVEVAWQIALRVLR